MSQGVFPEHLAKAVVICLYKSENPLELGNYRGSYIANGNYEQNIWECCCQTIDEIFLIEQFVHRQSVWFQGGMSTENAIQVLVNAVYDSFEQGNAAIGVFVDLSKAFDSLDRDHLCTKLEFYGIKTIN